MSARSAQFLTDDELERLKRRDPELVGQVVDAVARPLYRAARGLGFTETDAEDLVQDTLTTFLVTLDRFEGRSQVSTWVFGILHRKAQEHRRKGTREEPYDPVEEQFAAQFDENGMWATPPMDVERLVSSAELGASIRRCLDELPAPLREVFVWREIEGLGMTETSKILDRTVTHVGVQLHRARARLRACLDAQGWRR